MTPDDFVHLPCHEAERLAREAGLCVRVELTAPPRGPIEGCSRIVRACFADGVLVLTCAFYPQAQE